MLADTLIEVWHCCTFQCKALASSFRRPVHLSAGWQRGRGGGGNISQPRHMHQSAVAKSFSQFRLKPAVFPDGPSGCCALCSLKTTSFWPSVLWKKCVTPLYSPKTGKQLELQFPMKKLKLAQRHKTIMWENSEMGPQIITRHIMLHELSPRTPPPPQGSQQVMGPSQRCNGPMFTIAGILAVCKAGLLLPVSSQGPGDDGSSNQCAD